MWTREYLNPVPLIPVFFLAAIPALANLMIAMLDGCDSSRTS
jgi:hypothetical protein